MTKIVSMVQKDEEELSHFVVEVFVRHGEDLKVECEFFGIDEDLPNFMCFMPRGENSLQEVVLADNILRMRILPIMKKAVKKVRGRNESKDL